MVLIKKIGTRKQGKSIISWGFFLCPYCKQIAEKQLGNGKQAKSCGCMRIKLGLETKSHHGDSKSGSSCYTLYKGWFCMKARCSNPKKESYHRYGGRGIRVCELWNDYLEFKKFALAHGWKKGLQIDRIDNDGNYEPDNCRFVTSTENNQNRSTTKLNWDAVSYIRELHMTKLYTQSLLARMFKVAVSTICEIVHNKTWKENNQYEKSF